jgi:LuxR family maltose regulon positive regulatory protein
MADGSGTRAGSSGTGAPEPGRRHPRTVRLAAPSPGAPENVFRRQLVDLLRRGARGPLTLVSAPAGYGKTVLVDSWADTLTPAVTLVRTVMRQGDESPELFWASATASMSLAGVSTSSVPAPAATEGLDQPVLNGLIDSVNAHVRPVVWVLDCDALVMPLTLGRSLSQLIDACPEQLRLVLLTRADPPLPLHRYRLTGSVTEIRAADLVFTATDTARLLQRAGLDLSPVDALTLRSRTGGWPAGLRFAAMALAGRVDAAQAISEFRGDSGNVADYLMTEVFARQTPWLQELLLRTCIADEVTPGLATVLSGQNCEAGVLQFVAHGNSFMEPVAGKPGCYRYQSLFREFLRSQLAYSRPQLETTLHRAAAEWLAQDGQILPALHHAVAAEAWPLASRILVDGLWVAGVLVGERRTALRRMFAKMPPGGEGVEAAVTRAAVALADRDCARADAELDGVRHLLTADTDARSRTVALAASVLQAVTAGLCTDLDDGLEVVLAAENALRTAPPEVREEHPELVAVLARSKVTVLVERGELDPALDSLEEGIDAAGAPHLGDILEELQGMAALVHALRGDLRQAERIVSRLAPDGIDVEAGAGGLSQAALAALAWVRVDEYDLRTARLLLKRAEGGAPTYDPRVVERILALVRARLLAAQGEPALGRAALRAVPRRTSDRSPPGWLDQSMVLGEATMLLAEGRPEEAATLTREIAGGPLLERDVLLQRALLAGEGEPRVLVEPSPEVLDNATLEAQVDVWMVLAEQAARSGDTAVGEARVERALRLAAPQRLRRPFLEADDHVGRLLQRISMSGRTRWLRASGDAHDEHHPRGLREQEETHGSAPRADDLVSPLTKKEQEVLVHLAELLTTEEIAEAMYVSVNTVRSHVRNILRKLGVARRNDAVRRAWELRLLPPPNVA